uniref:N-terminal kinase-like protein n=1 Tax=Plectus sambesii TaxID=2011161 RepID=A0A914X2H6_9BILA
MASVLSSFFSRDPRANFGYELPTVSFYSENGISMGKSCKKGTNEPAVCFWASSTDYGGGGSTLKVQIQKLKTLRHPNMLTFLDSLETDNMVYLITEPCRPLTVYLEEAKLAGVQKDLVVSWGLYQILSGLKFLHQGVKLSHEALRRSVYVTAAGDWKLANFDQATEFRTAKTDMNALGILIWEIFNGFRNGAFEKPEPPGQMPKMLHGHYKKMVTAQAAKLSADEIISECRAPGGYMKNKFVDTLLFLEQFQLKEAREKQGFFSSLKDNLDMVPPDVAKYKILPKLIEAYEYGDAGSHILTPLFKLGGLLEEDEYQARIVPCLVKLFSSPDRITRVKLLEKIDEFAPHLSAQIVNEKIYTNLATGFLDTNPAVRESTVKAMVALADKLNSNNLNTDLMKYLARLQGSDDQPGIRTNTTICLGKISCFMDPQHRQRILISAFTRATKDPFPPARVAAVLALAATQQYYSLVEVANKILPSLSPLTCDPEKQVRDQAFKALKGFLEKLEKASENPDIIPELEAQVMAGGKSGLLSQEKVPQWASWALKSLSGKFYKSASPQPQVSSSVPAQQQSTGPIGDQRPTPSPAAANNRTAPTTAKPPPASFAKKQAVDGWGEMDDDEDVENDDGWAEKSPEKDTPTSSNVERNDDDDEDADWSSGWEQPKAQSAKFNAAPATKTNAYGGNSGGSMKLSSSTRKQSNADDNLDELLGVTAAAKPKAQLSSSTAFGPSGPVRTTLDKKNKPATDGWEDNSAGWGESAPSTNKTAPASGWDDDGWGDSAAQTTSSDKDARKAELAARNEQRRKELAAKKQARGTGAMKLTTKKAFD